MDTISVKSLLNKPGSEELLQEERHLDTLSGEGEELKVIAPWLVQGKISHLDSESVLFEGQSSTKVIMNCARCNTPVEVPIEVNLKQRFVINADDKEPFDDEIALESIEDGRIALYDVLLYEMSLAVPMKVLCKEDCKGLCPVCGQNLNQGCCACKVDNTDPRWDALKDLIK